MEGFPDLGTPGLSSTWNWVDLAEAHGRAGISEGGWELKKHAVYLHLMGPMWGKGC